MVVREVSRRTSQTPTDVIMQATAAAICTVEFLGGDDASFDMRHEAVGIVHQVGSSMQTFKKVNRVTTSYIFQTRGQDFAYGERNIES
jgi:threonine dehydrogenase-like Zn-dependent dehydrogenase